MVDFWKINQTSTNGAVRYWDLIETLLEAGWEQIEAGSNHEDFDVKYPASIDGVPGMTMSEHLDVNRAWIRMRDPAGLREILLQRENNATRWWFLDSPLNRFVSGAPSATVRPSATDEMLIADDCVNLQPSTNSRHHCKASDVAPFPFYLVAYPVGGGNYTHLTLFDAITPLAPLIDADPTYWIRGGNNSGSVRESGYVNNAPSSASLTCRARTTAPETLMVWLYCSSTTTAGYLGFSANNSPNLLGYTNDLSVPGMVVRPITLSNPGIKGLTTDIRFTGVLRASGDTLTESSLRDRIYILTATGAFTLPWNGDEALI